MNHILTTEQFSIEELTEIMERAYVHERGYLSTDCSHQIGNKYYPRWTYGKILTNLFYEPSSRTSSSFFSAMVRLGGQVNQINEVNYSSVVKGETLEDTIRTMQCYSDVIVLRHSEVGAAQRAANVANIPIINAGDGVGEHPTQALLDLFTILMERNWHVNSPLESVLNGMTVTMMGDLKHGRTVKSLAKLLKKFDVKIIWVSPEELRIPSEFISGNDCETNDLKSVIKDTDVLYMTRVQKERMTIQSDVSYGITLDDMKKAKSCMILMHPLPRVNEIPTEIDNDRRAAYFRQMQHGLYLRMAVLEMVLGG